MTNATPIDSSKFPDLLRIAEEVQTTKTARLLKRDRETIALLTPIETAGKLRKRRGKTDPAPIWWLFRSFCAKLRHIQKVMLSHPL
jgi:hypothetical protein